MSSMLIGPRLIITVFPKGLVFPPLEIIFVRDNRIVSADLLGFFRGKRNGFKILDIFFHEIQSGVKQEGSTEEH